MRNKLILMFLFLFISACAITPLQPKIQTLPENPALQPSALPNDAQSDSQTSASADGGDAKPAGEYGSGSLWLQITYPNDGDLVTQEVIEVIGQAPEGTVISLNEEIIVVGADGQFTAPIQLDEGPNVIELVASDQGGNEIDLLLTVVYEKE